MKKSIMVTRSSMPEFQEYVDEIKDLWDTHWLTNMGVKHQELEKQLKEYLSAENISLFTNGHMALELAIQGMDLSGEVITTPFTFASTTHAIVRNGLTPVFCDINLEDYTMDVTMLESLITDKTSAIVPVHVYGNICNVDEIQRIADKYNLKVIYDAAHVFGVKYKGKGIVGYGDASMLSFHATKVFNTIEGGAICFHDSELGLILNRLKNFGIQNEETVDYVGANAKMNEFQAAMGLCNLRHIDEEIKKREIVVERYKKNLKNIKGIKFVKPQKYVEPNYAYLPVLFDEKEFSKTRDEIYEILKSAGINARKYFYPLTNTFDCFKGMFDTGMTPNALYASMHILTLPLYADLRENEIDYICEILFQIKEKHSV